MEQSFDSLYSAFEASGLKLWEVFSLSDDELVSRLNRSLKEIHRFRNYAAENCHRPQLRTSVDAETGLLTGIPSLDALLGGGLVTKSVVEITGPAGAGKTCLCSQIALANADSAVYFACEEKISTICRRIKDIETTQPANARPALANTARFAQVRTASELRIGLNKLRTAERKPSVIIIDSITAVLAASGSNEEAALELEELDLKRVAFELDAVIVISNQVRDTQRTALSSLPIYHYSVQQLFVEGDAAPPHAELRKRPAHGMVLANHVNTRLLLSRHGSRSARIARIVYSNSARPDSIRLEMTSAGLVAAHSEDEGLEEDSDEDSDEDLLTYYSSAEPMTPVSI